ncbi:alpha/beta hydrolase [Sphingomonas kyeonggiensis]|uniref:Pimeloyl-ACP methyl ester carboxylesterase n=1 Tax=Sphingomonas kyeonggiensis TaxID=1268553 RepID=A0A7W6JQ81_9SPHN|nr:alpha/beta hydrolase [Sphingomonas kyeonggiensis]MBB4096481.1 pimeloyl-ACP methyl ester carboxylesterase [Sphingomonas kyeonggiensis]
MPENGLFDTSLPTLTIYDRADRPSRNLLTHAGQIIELGAGGGGRNLWAARLDEAVRLTERPVILVAHGIGCFAVTWWARLSPASYVDKVAGAVFVRPLGSVVGASPEQLFAGPRLRIAFPSILADTGADAAALARDWGSRFLESSPLRSIGELLASLRGDADDMPEPERSPFSLAR